MTAKHWIAIIGLFFALGTLILLTQTIRQIEQAPMVSTGQNPVIMEVERGSSFTRIAQQIAERNLYNHPRMLGLYARYKGIAGRLQAGEYQIPPGESVAELLRRMAAGDVIQYEFTIIEGWRFDQLLTAIRANPLIKQTLTPSMDGQAVMAAIGREGVHPEGQFLPETYHFPRGLTDVDLLRRANRALEQALAQAWTGRTEGLPLASPEEALILASIIEKETGRAEERRQIAGVFTRRLQQGMRLQTDPTVIYGLGEDFDGDLLRIHLRTDTPYNTYTRHGLPPTPIALPGIASIRAAVNPAEGSALFFVSRGDGSHVFSDNYDDHRAAVRRYQLGIEE